MSCADFLDAQEKVGVRIRPLALQQTIKPFEGVLLRGGVTLRANINETDSIVETRLYGRTGKMDHNGGPVRFLCNFENLLDRRYFANFDSNTNISPATPQAVRAGFTASSSALSGVSLHLSGRRRG